MMSMAMDWTYDLYVKDIKESTKVNDDYRKYFVEYINNAVKNFKEYWVEMCGKNVAYSNVYGYIGDAFAERLGDWFSDFYKDAYGQRPHLPMWYYVHAIGLPMEEDIARTFCASPVEDAIENASCNRSRFTN